MLQRYWLAKHAYPAVLGPQTIFFHSVERSFCALRTSWIYLLRTLVEDWGMPEIQCYETTAEAAPQEYAAYLEKRGLLTRVVTEGKRMEQLQMVEAQYGVDRTNISQVHVGLTDTGRLLHSALIAAWKFQHRSFDSLVRDLAQRRIASTESRAGASAQRLSQLVSAYWHLRPLLPFDRYTDLLDSLALIEYLSRYHVIPRVVIGVQLMPFASHTWVQEHAMVLNDTPEFVRQFTPIFSA